ncbi:MAG: PQQ-binding-like beta-propeller repeat protein [Planctomycetes bacterium]|nr:PQQ-binding-like beta-propeller repeat protein [Planctomycetota bacterium]MCH2583462.1 PQQ-binding-like beta-propeller repeat protein [Planctomycetota bacterium]
MKFLNPRRLALLYLTLLLSTLVSSPAGAREWTRFRGPNGSGVSAAKTVPAQWKESDFNWKITLPGKGISSPVVWDELVFVTTADNAAQKRTLLAISALDGKTRWTKDFPYKTYRKHRNNSYASSTPAVDGERVYTLWQSKGGSQLVANDHAGGESWRYDLGPYLHGQGGGTSPIIFEGMVIISNDHKKGSFLLAVDRATGKERWKIPREGKRACYSTPCVFSSEGRPTEIVFVHCFEGIVGVDPKSGRQNWMIDVFGTFPQRAVGSPVAWKNLVVANSGALNGGKNAVVVRPSTSGKKHSVKEVYRISRSAPHVPSPLAWDGRLFLWSDLGVVTCCKVETGEIIWQKRAGGGGNFHGSPVCVDGRLFCADDKGTVVVLSASGKFEELGRNELGDICRSTPAVSGGRMFVRTESRLFSVGGKKD